MKHVASYRVRLPKPSRAQRDLFARTVEEYRAALSFLIGVVASEWEAIDGLKAFEAQHLVERLVHATKANPDPEHGEFDVLFRKFPSYLRRNAIVSAIGKVSSFKSNHDRWEQSGAKKGEPRLSCDHYEFPAFYKPVMYERTGGYACKVKVFDGRDWVWTEAVFRKSDADYIDRRRQGAVVSNPTLERRGKSWSLRFCVKRDVELTETPEHLRRVCAVDLGVNKCATMVAMEPDGTVVGRRFFDLPVEKDRLRHALGRVKKAQRAGARRTPRLWALADNVNSQIAKKTARAIVDFAALYSCETVVFEHLDMSGKIRGSAKQRLSLWRKREVQRVAASQAHLLGMRVSRVCAWGTSRLAFDGSGRVERGREAGLRSYSRVRFSTGKVYDADLNAAKNIGARYFVRAKLKPLPERVRLAVGANVPGCAKRTTCTLSSLISLDAELATSTAAGSF